MSRRRRPRTSEGEERIVAEYSDSNDEGESQGRERSASFPGLEQPMLLLLEDARKKEAARSYKSLLSKMLVRCIVASVMFLFAYCVYIAGHLAISAVIFGLQLVVFKELLAVRHELRKEREIPLYRVTMWLWFAVACFYAYGPRFLIHALQKDTAVRFMGMTLSVPGLDVSMSIAQLHRHLAFSMGCGTFILTVMTLKKGLFEYQMQQLAWMALTVGLVLIQTQCLIENVFTGIFWVVFPGSLVIINDVMAYFAGVSLGRRIYKGDFLPDLSPNKTWEGFIGALVFTTVAGVWLPRVWGKSPYMTCTYNSWRSDGELCVKPSVFVARDIQIGPLGSIYASPMQFHGFGLAIFASLVAPFGGFFASAVKRAYGIKDFGQLFPGHGGFTDRLDCQFIMGLCMNVHHSTFIAPASALPLSVILASVASLESSNDARAVIQAAVSSLPGMQESCDVLQGLCDKMAGKAA